MIDMDKKLAWFVFAWIALILALQGVVLYVFLHFVLKYW
jgi:hypothetical protein